MAFPSSSQPNLSVALSNVQNYAAGIKSTATAAVTLMAANSINTAFVFSTLDQLSGVITNLNTYKSITGLNAYATANIPNYAGTLTTDIAAIVTAAQAAITWVVTNASGAIWYTLNADGTRALATFTPTQTAGWQTALTALVATIN
jgi:hypothetical protein